jgi:DMSO/TMAO reductase YedYZ molybdopterin-dependent catalytic subunit
MDDFHRRRRRQAQVLDLDALLKIAPLEERIYRHRCVEAWSIVARRAIADRASGDRQAADTSKKQLPIPGTAASFCSPEEAGLARPGQFLTFDWLVEGKATSRWK